MKQKSGGIKRLMEFTGKHRGLLTVSRILDEPADVLFDLVILTRLTAKTAMCIFNQAANLRA